MKRLHIISILLSAAVMMSVEAGCKKDGQEEPVVIYYSQDQQQEAATITLQNADTAATTAATAEVLAPIIANQTTPQAGAASTPSQAVPSNPGETTVSQALNPEAEATVATTTAAATTQTTAAATTQTTAAAGDNAGDTADVPSISSGSHIYDNAGVIADEGSVNAAMSSFESNTGVSPAIFTISDQLSGDDFRQYAREVYSSNFDDQDHVVIVYQMTPEGTWSWTCVFGTNTGTVFTQDNIDTFQSDLTNAFSSSNVDNALESAFNNAQNTQN
ncbi:MAG: TPM domain-containing protein [Saccharofermentans sp.]|nr:TPM domain-containing protein [Saccharofermentans sp.]